MIYRDLIWVAVFVQYLAGISGDTLNRAYRRRSEYAFYSEEAYLDLRQRQTLFKLYQK